MSVWGIGPGLCPLQFLRSHADIVERSETLCWLFVVIADCTCMVRNWTRGVPNSSGRKRSGRATFPRVAKPESPRRSRRFVKPHLSKQMPCHPAHSRTKVGRQTTEEHRRFLVLQCHFDLSCGQMGSSAECLHYPRPEPFFAPFAVPTMYRTVGPKLLLW
jgi:hypothetical protein